MLLEQECYYGLGMGALVTVCSWNTNGIWNTNVSMVWAWVHWLPYALGTRTELWFGDGCTGYRKLLEHEQNYGLVMDAQVIVCSWNRNTNVVMVWAWTLWLSYALGARMLSWFGHGVYGLGMDALVIALTRTRMLVCFGHGCAGHRMQKYWPAWGNVSSGFKQRNRRTNPAPKADLGGKGKSLACLGFRVHATCQR